MFLVEARVDDGAVVHRLSKCWEMRVGVESEEVRQSKTFTNIVGYPKEGMLAGAQAHT